MADEFRVERESVRLTVQGGKLNVQLFNGKSQKPSLDKSYNFSTTGSDIKLKVTRQGSSLLFDINGQQLGSIADSGIFKSGNIWFGLDSKVGNWNLTGLQADKLNGGNFEIADSSELKITDHDPEGLQALAAKIRPDFLVGAAQALGTLTTDPEYAKVALDSSTLGSFTPENLMKMANLQPQKGVYTFELANGLVHLAKQNGIKMHGHALIFGEANPAWFNELPVRTTQEKKVIEDVMIDHVTTVVKHLVQM